MPETFEQESRALVIIPTFNERATIETVVELLFEAAGPHLDLLVVDDGSPDGTARVVRDLARLHAGRIHLLERDGKRGLASAYLTGFRWAEDRGYDAVVEMDGDLSHDPAAAPSLLNALQTAELVIGSRYVPGGSIENWSRLRRGLSYAGNLYARMWLGFPIRDSTSGFRAYRIEWLRAQDLDSVSSEGYAFQIEMTRRVRRSGGRVYEIPIHFVERAAGKSKLSRSIVLEALVRVPGWGISDRLLNRKRLGNATLRL